MEIKDLDINTFCITISLDCSQSLFGDSVKTHIDLLLQRSAGFVFHGAPKTGPRKMSDCAPTHMVFGIFLQR